MREKELVSGGLHPGYKHLAHMTMIMATVSIYEETEANLFKPGIYDIIKYYQHIYMYIYIKYCFPTFNLDLHEFI